MAKLQVLCAAVIVVLAMVGAAQQAEAAISCGSVVSYLSGCIPYVRGSGPLANCCGGVRGLYAAANSTPDRRTVCSCLKSLAGSLKGVNFGKAAGLPKMCGVNIPYQISPTINCASVK